MGQRFADIRHMQALEDEGRLDELLAFLQQLYGQAEASPAPARRNYFMTMFQWKMLMEKYAPATAALVGARDEQVRRLLAGELYSGVAPAPDDPRQCFDRAERIALIVEMNQTLGDPQATHALFLQLEAQQPALARRYAWRVLQAIVDAGDFALADRYRGDPLDQLATVNDSAQTLPLYPGLQAPRLASDLSNLAGGVRVAIAVLRGLGREAEAAALRAALMEGLANDEMRALATRELEERGAISRLMAGHRTALEEAAG